MRLLDALAKQLFAEIERADVDQLLDSWWYYKVRVVLATCRPRHNDHHSSA